jgi:hypothetical protein
MESCSNAADGTVSAAAPCCSSFSSDSSSVNSPPSSLKVNLNLSRLPPKKRSGHPTPPQHYFDDTDHESDSDDELIDCADISEEQPEEITRRKNRPLDGSSPLVVYCSDNMSINNAPKVHRLSSRKTKELELIIKEEQEEEQCLSTATVLSRRSKRCTTATTTSSKKKKHRKTRYVKKQQQKKSKTGRWTIEECKAFLLGLQKHGKGKWSRIAKEIPTR